MERILKSRGIPLPLTLLWPRARLSFGEREAACISSGSGPTLTAHPSAILEVSGHPPGQRPRTRRSVPRPRIGTSRCPRESARPRGFRERHLSARQPIDILAQPRPSSTSGTGSRPEGGPSGGGSSSAARASPPKTPKPLERRPLPEPTSDVDPEHARPGDRRGRAEHGHGPGIHSDLRVRGSPVS